MTYNDLEKTCYLHHTAWTRGYVSRRGGPVVVPYKGKFGTGYKAFCPSWKSTTYCHIEYWIYK